MMNTNRKLQVVLVDDDKVMIMIHKMLAKKNNLSQSPLSFYGGKPFVDYLQNASEDTDYLILLDINMPEMDGWGVLESLKNDKLSKNISVVMVSSSVNIEDKQKAKSYKHVIDYAEKPINYKTIENIKKLPDVAFHFS